jgi:hypothetical protein
MISHTAFFLHRKIGKEKGYFPSVFGLSGTKLAAAIFPL